MALSPITDRTVVGCFKSEHGPRFEYYRADDNWLNWMDVSHGINAEIVMCDGSTRYARLLKTVVYVVVDEDAEGNPVFEKWHINHDWSTLY